MMDDMVYEPEGCAVCHKLAEHCLCPGSEYAPRGGNEGTTRAICNLGADDPADDDAWLPCPRCVGKLVRRARLEGMREAEHFVRCAAESWALGESYYSRAAAAVLSRAADGIAEMSDAPKAMESEESE